MALGRYGLRRRAAWTCPWLSVLAVATCAPDPSVEPFLDLVPVAVSSVPLTRSSEVALATQTTACIGKSYETRVYCVDRTGNVVGNFGREGDGPGEFNSITHLARGPGGTIGVFDWGLSRMTVFMPDGTMISETTVPPLFAPARSFLSTVSGYSVGIPAPSDLSNGPSLRTLIRTINLLELDLTTGEVLWTRQDLEYLDEDGCYPIPGIPGTSGGWVFKGCSGVYFLDHRDARNGRLVKSPTYVPEFPNDRDVAAHLEGMRFSGPLPAELLKSYEEEYRAKPKNPFLGTGTLVYDSEDRLWYATSQDRDNFSYLDVWVGNGYAGTVRIRDRLMGYDILGSTLVALVERKPGRDGIAARAIDWYDIGDVEFPDLADRPGTESSESSLIGPAKRWGAGQDAS